MANPSKAKGTAAETAVVKYARENGFPLADRLTLTGRYDRGDIGLCPGVIVEVKHHATYSRTDIEEWQRETFREQMNANASIGILVIRPPQQAKPQNWVAWRLSPQGWWHAQYLDDCLLQLRDEGWGKPNE